MWGQVDRLRGLQKLTVSSLNAATQHPEVLLQHARAFAVIAWPDKGAAQKQPLTRQQRKAKLQEVQQ